MSERTTEDDASAPAADAPSGRLMLLGELDGSGRALQVLNLPDELPIGRGELHVADQAEDRTQDRTQDPTKDQADLRWQIPDSTISRQHARVLREGDDYFLEDLGSRNGTWVDGTILRGRRARLREGALIVLASEVAAFRRMTAEQLAAVASEQQRPLGPVGTCSPLLAMALRRLRILARTEGPILLAGETGTGKEVYARALHQLSGRPGPFVAVNCASFQRDLFESELFGYRRGSHSQASEDHPGILSTAEEGTLFLDEIGEMEPALQTKLLRFLQDRSFFGLGARRARRADVRIVAATQSPQASLRADIIGRFGAEAVTLPPLRKRREDLPALCRHFLARVPADVRSLDREAAYVLCLHRWRRNIRELEATLVEGALSAADRGAARIGLSDLPTRIRALASGPRPRATASEDDAAPAADRQRPTRAQLEELLRAHGGQVPEVARRLGRRRELVWRWCRQMEIDPNAFKEPSPSWPGSHFLTKRRQEP
jgi:transcriptional regulator with PAS, ATPase and Fis domain